MAFNIILYNFISALRLLAGSTRRATTPISAVTGHPSELLADFMDTIQLLLS